ncbi:hypothetical protein RKE29_02730 [Streptomyces sp. B1866]|uniref:hypothetical protein n=1 Tax=Streptomyces sp. B1866 TaxID=3075431 RepID=UPI00288FF289|nr:hypothetical protein [Streptomyces sp. B1866]MDT3395574.1 hypothetical protein [Streptomyces sp. B1866]
MSRRRHHHATETTRNTADYRATATWPGTARPLVWHNADRRQVRRKARQWADNGAHVVIARHRGGTWHTLATVDGPARHRAAAEHRARVDARLDADTAAFVDRVLTEHAEARHDDLARLMRRPPAPRPVRARHTTGGDHR